MSLTIYLALSPAKWFFPKHYFHDFYACYLCLLFKNTNVRFLFYFVFFKISHWRFLKKLQIEQPYDPAIPFLCIYLEKTIIQKESCTKMFIAALFTIARTWKQPKCPSTDEWIKKMWHIYTMKYYSATKRNEIEVFVVRWMDLESAIQSEISQREKNKYRMLTHIYGI